MSPPRLLLTLGVLTIGAVLSPLGVGAALAHPTADFDWTPKPVLAGTTVTFVDKSTPFDATPESVIDTWAWNLHGSGTCAGGNASATCAATAPGPGDWQVTLDVVDAHEDPDGETKIISVQPPATPPNRPPTAAFVALPSSPLVGEEVTFVSYSDDPDGRINGWAWDLDSDDRFDDGNKSIVSRRFAAPGTRRIELRVTDDRGAASTASLDVSVRAGGTAPPTSEPKQPLPKLLSPFPIVRLVGGVTSVGTDIQLLSVRAPKRARALVRCRGRACPVRRLYKLVRSRRPVHFKRAERLMPGGVTLEVLVRRGDRIGKFTSFKLRRNRRPLRRDGCLWPGTNRMAPCPED